MMMVWQKGRIRGAVPVTQGLSDGASGERSWVVKVGGSLLGRPHWPDEIGALLETLAGPATIVVGGGAIVDGLRSIDAACPRPAGLMHRLAIEAMGLTAEMVADATGLTLAAAPRMSAQTVVLDAAAWLAGHSRAAALPIGWHVTSDSIAALVAAACDADLLLAKSVPPPASDLAQLARAGWVDAFFPTAAASLPEIHWAATPLRGSPSVPRASGKIDGTRGQGL
ncbi:MAG: hypothetical protein ACR2IT_04880 [Pirellulales bacterium]